MSAQAPEPGPDDEPATPSPSGAEPAPSPSGAEPAPSPSGAQPVPLFEGGQVVAGGGVLDLQVVLDALAAGGFLVGPDEDSDELAAVAAGRLGPRLSAGQVAALAVEHMDPGPAMAGWLDVAGAEADSLNEYGLTGVVAAGQKLASWAQAAELAAVAQVASRVAAADKNIGVGDDGRPARVCRDATGQVSLALTMSDCAAAAWADLAVTLSWRLSATGQALAAGKINLYRARRIAEATSELSEAKAREVEAKILPCAGQLTPAKLRERLRRAVIAADPAAAERRSADAERDARVSLYPDDDGTATLTGTGLPAALAAAAMARITAMARARKAAGLGGGLDLHRAQVMLGLLLDTLPPTPPPHRAPSDPPPRGDRHSGPEDSGPEDSGPEDSGPEDSDPNDSNLAGGGDPGSDPGPSSGRDDSDGGGYGGDSDPGSDSPSPGDPGPSDHGHWDRDRRGWGCRTRGRCRRRNRRRRCHRDRYWGQGRCPGRRHRRDCCRSGRCLLCHCLLGHCRRRAAGRTGHRGEVGWGAGCLATARASPGPGAGPDRRPAPLPCAPGPSR